MTAHDKSVLEAFELVTATVIEARRRVDGVNDWPHSVSRGGVDTALRITTQLLESSRQDLATNLATVRSTLKAVEILDDDSFQLMQLGVGLARVRNAVEKVDEAAKSAGYNHALTPVTDIPQMMHAKSDFGELIEKMEEGFAGLAEDLQSLQQSATIDGSVTQVSLVNFFANQISLKIDLGQMILSLGDIFNLFELGRVTSGIGRLTKRFKSTVMDKASRASAALKSTTAGFARDTGKVMTTMSAVLKRATKPLPDAPTIEPPDEETRAQWEFEAAISIVKGEPIPRQRLEHIESLHLSVFDNEALEDALGDFLPEVFARDVRRLRIEFPELITQLHNLKRLIIDATDITDLSVLSRLKNLERLECFDTDVSDLAPISELVSLKHLDMGLSKVRELEPVKNLKNLEELKITECGISSLTPLLDLHHLKYVAAEAIETNDWSPVDHVTTVIGRPKDWIRKPRK